MMKKSLLLLLCLALVATACGGSAEETVEEPVATEEVETLSLIHISEPTRPS